MRPPGAGVQSPFSSAVPSSALPLHRTPNWVQRNDCKMP